MQYTSNQHKSIQDFTYIHTKGPVRFIGTCDYFPESYYDTHTNPTEICPDYYIYLLERSICLIISIMIDIR